MSIAVPDRGISEPIFRTSTAVAINTPICINVKNKQLLPFIHKYHGNFNYLFWQDLASSHYSKYSLNCMDERVNYVDKKFNPPNVAPARPIETF